MVRKQQHTAAKPHARNHGVLKNKTKEHISVKITGKHRKITGYRMGALQNIFWVKHRAVKIKSPQSLKPTNCCILDGKIVNWDTMLSSL